MYTPEQEQDLRQQAYDYEACGFWMQALVCRKALGDGPEAIVALHRLLDTTHARDRPVSWKQFKLGDRAYVGETLVAAKRPRWYSDNQPVPAGQEGWVVAFPAPMRGTAPYFVLVGAVNPATGRYDQFTL